jgi:hypothetical protein
MHLFHLFPSVLVADSSLESDPNVTTSNVWKFNTSSERWSVIVADASLSPGITASAFRWVHPLLPNLLFMFGGYTEDELW